ncbi:hypothetical protein [Escherichia phage vB_EcoM-LTH01]|uniref:ATP-dependent Clp protease proteolytic subunit n=1 Tax=Escherichia phage A5-4 TaxID=2996162 RepID=A0AAE9TIR8_9CAUD|nr:hypothetical protein A54_152 [Escherichia phage A5-4]
MEEIVMNGPAKNIWVSPVTSNDWRIYVTDLHNSPEAHIEAVDLIRSAPEGDIVNLYITSCGGYCDIADMYMTAISEAKATVVTHGIGEVASAATMIFLSGHVRICRPGSHYMFHNVQMSMGGDSALVFKRSDFYKDLFKEKYYDLYKGVMTEDELVELFDRAGEIYFTSSQMQARLTAEDEAIKKQMEADQQNTGGIKVEGSIESSDVDDAKEIGEGEFEIVLDEGYAKKFNIFTLNPRDFDEYNLDELDEIAECFGVEQYVYYRDELIEQIITAAKEGGK